VSAIAGADHFAASGPAHQHRSGDPQPQHRPAARHRAAEHRQMPGAAAVIISAHPANCAGFLQQLSSEGSASPL